MKDASLTAETFSVPPTDTISGDRPDRSRIIRDAIQTAIVDHRLSPGTKLSEDEVGEAFGCSRTVVRAALQGLAFTGLVTLERNRGAFVASPGAGEARQVFEARHLVEPELTRAAARRFTSEDAARLRLHIESERKAFQDGQRRAAIHLSGDLHLQIAAIAGNDILTRFLGELVARSSLIIALYGRSGISACGIDDHRDILAALGNNDEQGAAQLMTDHLRHIDHDLDLTRGSADASPLAELLRR